ncbi:hypothetical protein ACRE_059640 [Hapsidospora chrysogenum ATCC 11550]|uniref:Uncharacterized protein n=1 Tax=Hapsidospora chrysogenum (strain ATCC 11550 / CBS 779.69 / DSM 880 / IAM 14645 / JCM 23072 / IMI 49137) TaxID=857340 RepID=A0A086T1N1_HAPC1|nr:hypothetical protein ACRE_059640 [Hapsidospora chrysogenum ATCC 11550]
MPGFSSHILVGPGPVKAVISSKPAAGCHGEYLSQGSYAPPITVPNKNRNDTVDTLSTPL